MNICQFDDGIETRCGSAEEIISAVQSEPWFTDRHADMFRWLHQWRIGFKLSVFPDGSKKDVWTIPPGLVSKRRVHARLPNGAWRQILPELHQVSATATCPEPPHYHHEEHALVESVGSPPNLRAMRRANVHERLSLKRWWGNRLSL
jgi:hypothetical protein